MAGKVNSGGGVRGTMVPREEWVPAAAALALAVLVAAVGAYFGQETPAEPSWEFVHERSQPVLVQERDAWFETFRLAGLPPASIGTPAESVEVRIENERVEGTWDGPLSTCSRFEATLPARDFLVSIELVVDGEQVWQGRYGAGSGTPLASGC